MTTTQPKYKVIQNHAPDKFGRYARWGWSAEGLGCGGGYASYEAADTAARKALAEAEAV